MDTPSALLLLELPEQALAGIDLLSFTTTPCFKGVKCLPKGWHFAFVGSSTAFSERHGVWFEIRDTTPSSGPPLCIAKWDSATETLVAVTDPAERLLWRANLGGIWREGLTPYRQATPSTTDGEAQEDLVDWPKLTSHINDSVLTRITQSDSSYWSLSSASSAKRDLEAIPGLTIDDINLQADKELHFLPIDLKQTWREGATGRERTDAAQDRSWALNHIIEDHCNHDATQVIGELQFCFLMVLTLNNFSCLEQWKRILTLLLTCRSTVATNSELFVQVIETLTLQLQHCKLADSGLIDLADESGSLLKYLITRFRQGIEGLSSIGVQAVVDELDDLETYLRNNHDWQFGGSFAKSGVLELEDGEQVRMDTTAYDEDDETGEYAPQIVELTPEQARLLNVRGAEELHHGMSKTSLHEMASNCGNESGEDDAKPLAAGVKEVESGEESEAADDLDDMDARY